MTLTGREEDVTVPRQRYRTGEHFRRRSEEVGASTGTTSDLGYAAPDGHGGVLMTTEELDSPLATDPFRGAEPGSGNGAVPLW